MGELRPNHFHGGIDVKTEARTGLPIRAAADGYISKLRVSSFGYGNMIHITHPNGLVTLYAHLDKFNEVLWNHTIAKQYEKESFEIEINPDVNQFPIKKGDIIGLGGNTGGSGGPHLHFEIRDQKDVLYNPLLFGFPEIKDNLAPIFDKICFTTFNVDSRVNGEFGRYEVKPIKVGNQYQIPTKIAAKGTIGIELRAFDKMNGTYNSYGITCIEMKFDDKEIFYHNIKSFGFDENRFINAHINYQVFTKTGRRFEKCYISDGNRLSTYKRSGQSGKIVINDSLKHEVQINIYDAYNNATTLKFYIEGEKSNYKPVASTLKERAVPLQAEFFENILKITAKSFPKIPGTLYLKKQTVVLQPAYEKNGLTTFLYDLRKGLPDSVDIAGIKKKFSFSGVVTPGREHIFKSSKLNVRFSSETLFDTLYLQLRYETAANGREIFQVNDPTTPLFTPVEVSLNPQKPVADKARTHGYSMRNNGSGSCEGGVWEGELLKFTSKNLGKFGYGTDVEKPVVKLISSKGNIVRFNIFDKSSGISSFRATLNGKWVLMNYDHKRRLIWSELQDKTQRMSGQFLLEVKDKAGNTNTFNLKLI